MVEKIAPALAWTGYGYNRLRRSLDAGKKTRWAEEVETQKAFEDTKKILLILPVCRTEKENIKHYKGKQQREIIENLEDYKGKSLDIRV